MKRNLQNTNDIVRQNNEKLTCTEYCVKNIAGMLKEMKDDMKQYMFHIQMDRTDLSDFFPLENDEALERFMDKTHEDWEARKFGFYHLLFTTVTKQKKKFAAALLHTIFSRNFIATHRWPG